MIWPNQAARLTLQTNTRIGPYTVVARIGAGGMGEVYRAHDNRLGRDVALKILPPAFAQDPDRLARFQREAEVLASLNHPNIAHIFGLEPTDGVMALVMELVEGVTLAERMADGAIPLDEALHIARQIADALDAAHQQGIVHRDLKPANVQVMEDGTVKVVDFGVAKVLKPAAMPPSATTITSTPKMTEQGLTIGTVAYMSPEQAKGKPVDKRADIWAFGVVLFEMVTGRRLYASEGLAETFASILTGQADLTQTPPAVRRLLRKCLEKDPNRRLRDIGDAWDLLELPAIEDAGASAIASRGYRSLWVGGAILGAAAIAWMASGAGPERESPAPVVSRFVETLPEGRTLPRATGLGTAVALSPDGRTLVYRVQESGRYQLYRRFLHQADAEPIGDVDAAEPFFSPDGQWVAFRTGTTLKRVAVGGGPAHPIAELPRPAFRGASWNTDGTMVLGGLSEGLWRVAETGGELVTLLKPASGRSVSFPQLLPGGRAVIYTERSLFAADDAVFILDLHSGVSRQLLSGIAGRYLDNGFLVFANAYRLWAVEFNLERLDLQGTPVPVLEDIRVEPAGDGPAALVSLSVAPTGAIAYVSETASDQRSLVWVDRQGREQPVGAEPRAYVNPRVSPDGSRIAVSIVSEGGDIWIWNIARRTLRQLTTDAPSNWIAAWFPDGKRLAFSARSDGAVHQIHWQAADGAGVPRPLTEGPQNKSPNSISRDGKLLLFTQHHPTQTDTGLLPLDRPTGAHKLWQTPESERNPVLSPDGRWLAYGSDRSGISEVYVRPFPNVGDGEYKVTTGGGAAPVWARDGGELFFWTVSDLMVTIMGVPIGPGPRFDFGAPRKIVQGIFAHPSLDTQYDIAPDGRFVIMKPIASSAPDEIVIVLNWADELRRRVSTAAPQRSRRATRRTSASSAVMRPFGEQFPGHGELPASSRADVRRDDQR